MRKKLMFGFFTMISLFSIIATNYDHKVLALTKSDCQYNDKSHYAYNTSGYYYDTPTINYNSGTVYERDLTPSDFSSSQHEWQMQQRKWVTDIDYFEVNPALPSSCDQFDTYDGGTWGGWYQINFNTVYPDVTVVTTDSDRSDGITSYNATVYGYGGMNSNTLTESTYWVSSVSVTNGNSSSDIPIDQYSDLHTCRITYGNGQTFNCDQGTIDNSATANLISSVAPGMKSNMTSSAATYLNDFWAKNANNGPYTNPLGRAERINAYYTQFSKDHAIGGFSDAGSNIKNGKVQYYSANFGNLDVYAYVDFYTGKSAYAYLNSFHGAALDVEDETKSPNKKEILAEQKIWNGGQEYREDILANVSCTEYFYGPIQPRTCTPTVKTDNYDDNGYKHIQGTETLDRLTGGGAPVPGNGYRYIQYHAQFSDGHGYGFDDTDYRTVLYATKIQVNSAVTAVDPNGDGNKLQEDYAPIPDITVEETHDKGVKTPKDYPGGHEGYIWHAWQETYSSNFSYPTCSRSYAPSKIDGSVVTEDCSNDLYKFYASPGEQYNKVSGKEYWYDLGHTNNRDSQMGYLENGVWAYQDYTFHYAQKIKINVSQGRTYQDQSYPSVTCTKYYDFGSESCLNKMYVDSDSGQSKSMGNVRKVIFKYVNNDFSDTAEMDRVYANSTGINGPQSGKSGFRSSYDSWVNWTDGTTKNISLIPGVWDMKVDSTGESIPYIGRIWGYTDWKGNYQGNSSINELYIPNPISNNFHIISTYPVNDGTMGPFNNGLAPGYGYVSDNWAPVSNSIPFKLFGIDSLTMTDETSYVDPVDVDNNGNTTSSYPTIDAAPFKGFRSPPGFGGYAFNDKTYQTGSWYDYTVTAKYADGSSEQLDIKSHPELTWRFMNSQGNWSFSQSDYPVSGTNTHMPESGSDHRLLLDGWNPIRFDIFSESGIPMPAGQSNYLFTQSYIVGSSWAHEAKSLVITGPTVVSDPTATQNYNSYLNWSDMVYMNQDTSLHNANTNPWSNMNRTQVTNNIWTEWFKDTTQLPTPNSGPLAVAFPEFKANNHYRTISSSWGSMHRTLPDFKYWTYLTSQINVYFNANPGPNCDTQVPSMGCPLPIDNTYRMPKNNAIPVNRSVEMSLKLNASGVSTGSGE